VIQKWRKTTSDVPRLYVENEIEQNLKIHSHWPIFQELDDYIGEDRTTRKEQKKIIKCSGKWSQGYYHIKNMTSMKGEKNLQNDEIEVGLMRGDYFFFLWQRILTHYSLSTHYSICSKITEFFVHWLLLPK
jgi:hypothetical protein